MAALAKILPQLLPLLPELLKLLPQLAEALKDLQGDSQTVKAAKSVLTSSEKANIAKMNKILSSAQTQGRSRILASAKSIKRE
jgi:hypothetical protein